MTRRAAWMGGAVAAACVIAAGEAGADEAGDKALASVDAALNKAKTLYFDYEVTNVEKGKEERKLEFERRIKGAKSLTEFFAPSDMKGTKILVLSPAEIYVYLPAFGKVRRVTSSATDQGFLGLAFSQDDLSSTSFGSRYTGKVASESPTEMKLVLTPKAGQKPPYARIEMTVVKDKNLPTELKYFNAAGANVKTETRTGYSCEGDVCTPGELKMVDNTRGLSTRLTRKKWKVNETMPDDLFTKKSLAE